MRRSALNLDIYECYSGSVSANNSVEYDEKNDVSAFSIDGVLIRATQINDSIIYAIETATVPGKFDVQKAAALNIPRGPLYGKLKQGQDVTLEDGTVIRSTDVVGPSEKSRVVFIIGQMDITSSSRSTLLSSLLQRHPYFSQFDKSHGIRKDDVECVYHMGCRQLMEMDDYLSFVSSIGGSHVKHVSLGKQMSRPISAFIATSTYTNKLQRILPQLYPKLLYNGHDDGEKYVVIGGVTMHRGYPGLKYILSPGRRRGIEAQERIPDSEEEVHSMPLIVLSESKYLQSFPVILSTSFK